MKAQNSFILLLPLSFTFHHAPEAPKVRHRRIDQPRTFFYYDAHPSNTVPHPRSRTDHFRPSHRYIIGNTDDCRRVGARSASDGNIGICSGGYFCGDPVPAAQGTIKAVNFAGISSRLSRDLWNRRGTDLIKFRFFGWHYGEKFRGRWRS